MPQTNAFATLTFAEESLTAIRTELEPFLDDYYREVSCLKDTAPLDPDWDRYAILESIGMVLCLTARTEEGTLVGFFQAIMGKHFHSKEARCAFSDGFYLCPAYRGGQGGWFLRAIFAALMQHDMQHLFLATTLIHDLDTFYRRNGLAPFERVYYRHLEGKPSWQSPQG